MTLSKRYSSMRMTKVETLEQWVRAFVLLGACSQPDELLDHGDDPGAERGGTELG